MSTIDALSVLNDQPESPLELVGGFDAYQRLMKEGILHAAQTMTIGEIGNIDAQLSPDMKVDGLEQGLMGILNGSCQVPLTDRNLEILETLLYGFTQEGVIRPLLEPHLKQGSPGGSIGLFIDRQDPRRMDRRSGEFFSLGIALRRASGAEIEKRRTATREQALQSFSVLVGHDM